MNESSYPQAVRVYCTYQDADYENPWQTLAPRSSTSSGVVIGPGRVLTGAHCVANATFIQVQKSSSPDKIVAQVVAVSHDSDLALLEVAETFTDGVEPAELGTLSRLGDEVSVVGYPVGGDELSITEGIVSRIEVQSYEHSGRNLLAVTVDAAINSGNSGGPVFHEGRVVGIAFQSLEDAENIGEMVPAPVVRTFLEGVEADRPTTVPGLGTTVQHTENPALRRRLGLGPSDGGVLLNLIEHGSTAWSVLEEGDVLLSLDGNAIAANGTVRYRGLFRCQFDVVFGEHFVGDTIEAEILRGGDRRTVELELAPLERLVPRAAYDTRPTWFLFGGLVMTRVTLDFLRIWGTEWWSKAPARLVHAYYHELRTDARQELVVIAQVLADEVNVGYEDLAYEVIDTIDGATPADTAGALRLLEGASETVTLRTSSGALLHFEKSETERAAARIA
ncbi:MAG: trypsin-like peptidase domain-containing protein, partial [Planctomycetota bacterium]